MSSYRMRRREKENIHAHGSDIDFEVLKELWKPGTLVSERPTRRPIKWDRENGIILKQHVTTKAGDPRHFSIWKVDVLWPNGTIETRHCALLQTLGLVKT